MSTDNMPKAGDVVDNYRLLKPLAAGGTGILFKAHETMLDRYVAIKFLSPQLAADQEYVQEFFHEARALAKLNHPNIIQVYTVGRYHNLPYFAMEFVEGEDLHLIVQTRGPIPATDALKLIRQAAVGLQHAHKHGLIHRDIKPANLMLTTAGTIKVTDFGLAKNIQLARTATDVFAGTPEFTSPEEAKRKPVDHRTDIYSLGATLYFLLAGRPPFTGISPQEILKQHIEQPLPPIRQFQSTVPATANQVLEKAMAKQPGQRFQNCDALIRALDQLITGKPLPQLSLAGTPSNTPPAAPAKPKTKSPVTSFILTFIMLVLTLILWWYVRNYVEHGSKPAPPVAPVVIQPKPAPPDTVSNELENQAEAALAELNNTATGYLNASNYNDAAAAYLRWPAKKFAGTKAGQAILTERNRIARLANQAWIDVKTRALELRHQNRPNEAITLYQQAAQTFSSFADISEEASQLITAATGERIALQAQENKLRQLVADTETFLLRLEFEKAQQHLQQLWDTQPANLRGIITPTKTEVDRLATLKRIVIDRAPQRATNTMTLAVQTGKIEARLIKATADALTVIAKAGEYGTAETSIRWEELQPASAIQLFTIYISPTNPDEILAVGTLLFHYAAHNRVPVENARAILNAIATLDPGKKTIVNDYLHRLDNLSRP